MTKPEFIGTDDFQFTLPIEKSYTKTVDGEDRQYIAGLASATVVDYDDERMSASAIMAFKRAIDEGITVPPHDKWSLIPLRSGHRDEWDDVLGWVVKAEVDEFHNLWIEAELNNTSKARDLYAVLTTPQKEGRPNELGFSIGGKIKKASREWNQERMKSIRVFDEIALREVSVTGKPSCPPSYVEALTKSVNWDNVPIPYQEVPQELKENPMKEETEVVKSDEHVAEATKQIETINKDNTDNNVLVPNVTEKAPAEAQEDKDAKIAALEARIAALETKEPAQVATEAAPAATQTEPVQEVVQADKSHALSVEDVKKSLEGAFIDAIKTAFATFKTESIDPLTTELQTLKSTVQEMSDQPVDKSHSVRTAKETETLVEKFRANVLKNTSDKRDANPIEEAVRLAIREKK